MSPVIITHQMSLAGEGGGEWIPKSNVGGGGCTVRSWVMVIWGPSVDRTTDGKTRLKTLPSCNFAGGRQMAYDSASAAGKKTLLSYIWSSFDWKSFICCASDNSFFKHESADLLVASITVEPFQSTLTCEQALVGLKSRRGVQAPT